MVKTIFAKMVVLLLAVLLVGFSIAGVMMHFFLDRFVTDEKAVVLEKSSEEISEFFKAYIENRRDLITGLIYENLFLRSMEINSRGNNAIIWIVDHAGYIRYSTYKLPDEFEKRLTDETGGVRLPDRRQYEKVMSGNFPVVREVGDFYGFFKEPSLRRYASSWLTVQKLFEYKPSHDDTEVRWAVYLHTPVPEVMKARTSVFRFFLYSIAIATVISILLIYILSLRMTRPLKQISNAAKLIASGEFKKRLDIRSEDEIGELAGSFNQMAVALQKLEEMRKGFIANVSHELRTPMTSISGFIEGILDGTIPEEKHKDYLHIVKEEVGRLNRLVNDLLDLAKMEAGETVLAIREFDINELARRTVIKLENFIIKKQIRVEAEFEEEVMIVAADRDAIERVLYNLIHNAIKFTPENGSIRITTESQKDKVIVSVEDDGIGISAEEKDLIWDRFYKSDKSRGKDKTGTGLGLAIVKSIIHEHNQKIWVESGQGRGARFSFTLMRKYSSGD